MDVPSCRSKGQIRYSPLLTQKAKDDFITASFEMSNALSSKKFFGTGHVYGAFYGDYVYKYRSLYKL